MNMKSMVTLFKRINITAIQKIILINMNHDKPNRIDFIFQIFIRYII